MSLDLGFEENCSWSVRLIRLMEVRHRRAISMRLQWKRGMLACSCSTWDIGVKLLHIVLSLLTLRTSRFSHEFEKIGWEFEGFRTTLDMKVQVFQVKVRHAKIVKRCK